MWWTCKTLAKNFIGWKIGMIFFLILDDNSKLMGIFNLIRYRNYVPAKFLPPLPNCTNFIKCYEYPYSRSPISRKIKSFKFDNFLPFVFSFLPASLPFLVVKGIYLVTLDLSSISISIPRLRRSWIVEVSIDRAILMSKLALNRVWKNSLSLSARRDEAFILKRWFSTILQLERNTFFYASDIWLAENFSGSFNSEGGLLKFTCCEWRV